jgi:hypothetical protein
VTGPFSRTTLIAVVGVAAVSLAAAAVLTIVSGDLSDKGTAGADAYSSSAIGHLGLVRLLEKLDIPVVVSRSDSADKARGGLLIVAEPTVSDGAARGRLLGLVTGAPRTLVVLPKWYGSVERGKAWIGDAHLVPADEVEKVLAVITPEAPAGGLAVRLRRAAMPVAWNGDGLGAPEIREPQLLIVDDEHEAIVTSTGGDHLVTRVEHGDEASSIHVLADPDVLNNFGLRSARNARFTVQLIDLLRAGGPVVIDETIHGYAQQPSLVRTLLRFPLVLATLQVLVCAVLVVWAAMVRFGPRRAAPPPLAPGKDFLIRNTAALLHYGGHHGHALRRYLQLTVAAVRHALHAPSLAPTAMTAWLERVRLVRGGRISLVELEQAVETADTPARVVEVADQVFRWRTEMTHGTDSRS